jgi:hypothetical protein
MRMDCKRALEWWETKIENCEITPQAIWPIAKSLTKRGRPKAPYAIHGPSGPTFYPIDKANVIANYLKKNQSTPHEIDVTMTMNSGCRLSPSCAEHHQRTPSGKFQHHDVSKEIRSFKLGKACSFDVIPSECLRHLPRPLVHLTHLFNHCYRLCHFLASWNEAKIITLPKPSKDPKFHKNLRPISLLSTTSKLFKN